MYRTGLLFIGSLILLFTGCSDEIVSTEDGGFPEKLSPYESFFDLETLRDRRDDLIDRLPSSSIVVVGTNELYLRNGDVTYEFRPASTFYYLTGFDEPNAAAIIRPNATDPERSELIMFVEERSDAAVRWLGPTYGREGAVTLFGADEAFEYGALASVLEQYLESGRHHHIYANLEDNATFAGIVHATRAELYDVRDVRPVVDARRMIKTPIEIKAIRRAVDVSVQAFSEAMQMIGPGIYEYEVDALFDYVLRVNGSARAAFPTIVASGPNVSTLHYDANRRQMQAGELVMIDFGAEYSYYASDITRTLPVSGKYAPEQAVIYNIVRDAHRAVLETARPGVRYDQLYELARNVALDGLLARGIITGDKAEIIGSGRFRQYIPAGLGHCVGLDVHDPFLPSEGGEKILMQNMVFAFEPHLYLAEDDMTVAEPYRGVSARIEDTVLITSGGVEVLSGDLPMEIDEIEQRMD